MKDGFIKTIEGPAGTWVFFNPTDLIHRGVTPIIENAEKIVIEVIFAPAVKENFAPVFAGLNASHPWFPWTKI